MGWEGDRQLSSKFVKMPTLGTGSAAYFIQAKSHPALIERHLIGYLISAFAALNAASKRSFASFGIFFQSLVEFSVK